VSQNYNLAYHI